MNRTRTHKHKLSLSDTHTGQGKAIYKFIESYITETTDTHTFTYIFLNKDQNILSFILLFLYSLKKKFFKILITRRRWSKQSHSIRVDLRESDTNNLHTLVVRTMNNLRTTSWSNLVSFFFFLFARLHNQKSLLLYRKNISKLQMFLNKFKYKLIFLKLKQANKSQVRAERISQGQLRQIMKVLFKDSLRRISHHK